MAGTISCIALHIDACLWLVDVGVCCLIPSDQGVQEEEFRDVQADGIRNRNSDATDIAMGPG
jgi:hypothetical protein